MDPIVKRPNPDYSDDDKCTFCNEPTYLILQGPDNCYYCGQHLNLCEKHMKQMLQEIITFSQETLTDMKS